MADLYNRLRTLEERVDILESELALADAEKEKPGEEIASSSSTSKD